tara:strand:- start:1473 stop:1724 length:252 start_codon:yes stop_codon:yes gene_type:complete
MKNDIITLKEYLKQLNELVEEQPQALNFPLIYSHDDEGNYYQKVICFPSLAQIENIEERYLEIIGFCDETNILSEDCNAVTIN